MSQKYRVAVAIAILKSKPTELTINQYVDKLNDKINEKMDIDVISINSNDFNFDEEVFNESFNGANENNISGNENNDSAKISMDFDMQQTHDCLENCDTKRQNILNVLDILRHEKQQVIISISIIYLPIPGFCSSFNCIYNDYKRY